MRLNSLGHAVGGNNLCPPWVKTGPGAAHETLAPNFTIEMNWLDDQTPIGAYHIDGVGQHEHWAVHLFRPLRLVLDKPSTYVRASARVWAIHPGGYTHRPGFPLPDGLVPCDVSAEGIIVAAEPSGEAIQLIGPLGVRSRVVTGGMQDAAQTAKLRDGFLVYCNNPFSWHIRPINRSTLEIGPEIIVKPRTEPINKCVPIWIRGEVWIYEQSDRASLRRPNSDQIIIVENQILQYNSDVMLLGDLVRAAYFPTPGEMPDQIKFTDIDIRGAVFVPANVPKKDDPPKEDDPPKKDDPPKRKPSIYDVLASRLSGDAPLTVMFQAAVLDGPANVTWISRGAGSATWKRLGVSSSDERPLFTFEAGEWDVTAVLDPVLWSTMHSVRIVAGAKKVVPRKLKWWEIVIELFGTKKP